METNMIMVNGILMPLNEYRKQKRQAANQPKRKKKKAPNETIEAIKALSSKTKSIKLLKSLAAYYDNAYRQWGTVANIILKRKEISKPFVCYRVKVKEAEKLLLMISEMCKHKDKSVFQYIEKFSYLLDDIKTLIDDLSKGIMKSGLMDLYGSHEAINGYGRRLGLKTLLSRTLSATKQLQEAILYCNNIYSKGCDPLYYTKYSTLC